MRTKAPMSRDQQKAMYARKNAEASCAPFTKDQLDWYHGEGKYQKPIIIKITRHEGPTNLCSTKIAHSFPEANGILYQNSLTAPQVDGKPAGYDKHSVEVIFGDNSITKRVDVSYMTYLDIRPLFPEV